MDHNGSPCIRAGEGNTRPPPRSILGKKWCFTYNNPSVSLVTLLESLRPLTLKCVIGHEVAPTTGTVHYQGYLESINRIRPTEKFGKIMPNAHYEKAKGDDKQNWEYCTKDKNYVYHGDFPQPIYDHLDHVEPYPFQQYIIDKAKINCDPTDRSICWIYGNGRLGKTILSRHLHLKYGFLFVNGKGENILYAIAEYVNNNGFAPRGILYGFPKSTTAEQVSYNSMEQVKDGLFFSPKYKSGMCIFNPPHIIVLCNFYPDLNGVMEDRWEIYNIHDTLRTLTREHVTLSNVARP